MQRLLAFCLAGLLLSGHPARAGDPAPGEEGAGPTAEQALEDYRRELDRLRKELAAAQDAGDAEELRKQVELQRKQIEIVEKMARLLADELRTQKATQEAQALRGARRDQEMATEAGDLREQIDAERLNGPELPSTLRELFLPSRTNESPLSIYGTLAQDFQDFEDRPATFPSPTFSPHFYLLLNEQFLLEVNPEFRAEQVELESAQIDWFLSDHWTLVAGHFYSPLGFFNERLHTSWVFKTPDRPLVFQQVFPSPLSFTGLQLRGARYLGDWALKLEYAALVANGFSLDRAAPTPRDFADLFATSAVFGDINSDKAVGGRIGLSAPTVGLIVGLSGLANGAYDRAGEHDLSIWDVDVSWHWGNWDARFEYAMANQQSPGGPIRRQGFYAQLAYRCYDSLHPILQKLEGVVRFDHVQFDGIDLSATGLDFGPRERIPVDRNRYTVGLNYWFYPSLVVRVAYEINDELRFREINDDGFLAQVSWGF